MGLTRAQRWYRSHIKRGETEIFTEKMTVTPEIAAQLLSKNPDNRHIRSAKLAQYTDDMLNDRWQFNGETVIIAKTGEVNDGQHRLQAIVDSGKPQELNLTFGVERDSRYTIDTGVARTAGDHMNISGMSYGASLASVARMVISYERAKGEHLGRPNEVSSAAVIERVRDDELLRECAIWAHIHKKKGALTRGSVGGFVFYILSKKNPSSAKLFMSGLKEGIGLAADSPIRITREKLMSSPRLSTTQIVEIVFRGWNHWMEGNSINRLAVQGSLPKPQRLKPKAAATQQSNDAEKSAVAA